MNLRFSEPQRSETLTLRVTSEEKDYLAKIAAARQTTVAGVVRQALDLLIAQSSSDNGASDSGSRIRPSRSTANDSAQRKRSPSKSHQRAQSSH